MVNNIEKMKKFLKKDALTETEAEKLWKLLDDFSKEVEKGGLNKENFDLVILMFDKMSKVPNLTFKQKIQIKEFKLLAPALRKFLK